MVVWFLPERFMKAESMTRPCPQEAEWLDFVAGRLTPASIDALAAHLDDCAVCQATVRQARSGCDTLVGLLKRPPAPGQYDDEPQLRQALEHLAASPGEAGGLRTLNGPALEDARQRENDASAVRPLPRTKTFGPYEIIEELGRGGMGVVYKALQPHLDRLVAIKILPGERLRDPAAVARFKREMKAVAKLDHPNIVRAYDGGEVEGEHYLAIEYLEGVDLSRLVARLGALPLADCCELIRQAAVGLEHARSHGMVHRDIKPANLMLSTSGQVKILDLGLAMLAEHGLADDLTAADQLMGTLDYLAPEQAEDSHTVDIRADIYSLGCTFYKLLTGDAPFRGPKYNTPLKKILAHARTQPEPLGECRPDVPIAVAEILRRMMAKSPDDRFATPAEVVTEIAPFAAGNNLAVLLANYASASSGAAPGGVAALTETLGKSAYDGTHPNHSPPPKPAGEPPKRRSRRRFITAATAGALVLLATIVIIIKDRHGKELARVEAPDAASATIEVKPLAPPKPAGPKYPPSGNTTAQPPPAKPVPPPTVATDPIGPGGLAAWPVPMDGLKGWNLVTRDPLIGEVDAVFHPTEPIVATAGPDGVIRFRDAKTFEVQRAWIAAATWIERLAWSPDGRRLATLAKLSPEVTVFDYPAGKKAYVLAGHHGDVGAIQFSPDGTLIGTTALAPDSTLRIWDAANGRPRQTILLPVPSATLAWSADGTRVATFGLREKAIRLWEAGSGKALQTIPCPAPVKTGAWQPNSSSLAVYGEDHVVRLVDLEQSKTEELPLIQKTSEVHDLAWSPDGRLLALGEFRDRWDFHVSVWRTTTWSLERDYKSRMLPNRLRWSGDGQTLAVGGLFNELRGVARYEMSQEQAAWSSPKAPFVGTNSNCAWKPDSASLGAFGVGNSIRLWDFAESRETGAMKGLDAPPSALEWSPDGKWLACVAFNGRLTLWNAATRELRDSVMLDAKAGWYTWLLGWAKGGQTIVTANYGPGSVRLWNVSDGRLSARDAGVELGKGPFAVSATTDLLATQRDDGAMTLIWDMASAELRRQVPLARAMGCDWSPDAKRLAVSTGGQVSVIDAAGGDMTKLPLQSGWWEPVAWSPDGKYIVAGGGHSLDVCGLAAQGATRRWNRHAALTERLNWSPDKPILATSSADNTLRFWHAGRAAPLGMFVRRCERLVAIGMNGHVRGGDEDDFLYVALTDEGQEAFTPAEFEARFGWRNNPEKLRLIDVE